MSGPAGAGAVYRDDPQQPDALWRTQRCPVLDRSSQGASRRFHSPSRCCLSSDKGNKIYDAFQLDLLYDYKIMCRCVFHRMFISVVLLSLDNPCS